MHSFILTTRPNANTNTNVFSSWKLDRPCVPPSRRPRPPARGSGSGWSGWRGFLGENASPTWHHCCVAVIVFYVVFVFRRFTCDDGATAETRKVQQRSSQSSWSEACQVLRAHPGNYRDYYYLRLSKTWIASCNPLVGSSAPLTRQK